MVEIVKKLVRPIGIIVVLAIILKLILRQYGLGNYSWIIIIIGIIMIIRSFDSKMSDQYHNVLTEWGKYVKILHNKSGPTFVSFLKPIGLAKVYKFRKGTFRGDIDHLKLSYIENLDQLSKYFAWGWFGVKMQFEEKNLYNLWIKGGIKSMTENKPSEENHPWFSELMDDIRTSLMLITRYLGYNEIQNVLDLKLKTIEKLVKKAQSIQKMLFIAQNYRDKTPDELDNIDLNDNSHFIEIEDNLRKTLELCSIKTNTFVVSLNKLDLDESTENKLTELHNAEISVSIARQEALAVYEKEKVRIKLEALEILKKGESDAKTLELKLSTTQKVFSDALAANLTQTDKVGNSMTMQEANLSAKLVADLYTNEQIIEMTGSDGMSLNGFIEQIAAMVLTMKK